MTMRWFSCSLVLLAVAVGAVACEDDDDGVLVPVQDAVATFNDPSFDFGTTRTFAMPDSVVHLVLGTDDSVRISRRNDAELLGRVRRQMSARGFLEVTNPGVVVPDLVVLVAVSANQSNTRLRNYPWLRSWGFFGAFVRTRGFDTDWDITYPPLATDVEYGVGSILVTALDLRDVRRTDKRVRVVWAALGREVITGSETADRVRTAVDEMFLESPYLAPRLVP